MGRAKALADKFAQKESVLRAPLIVAYLLTDME